MTDYGLEDSGNEQPKSQPEDILVPQWTDDGHLDEGTIHTWLDDAFEDVQSELVRHHVDACAMCQGAVAEARGFIAGASRVVRMLDGVPAGVVAIEDAQRTAARIAAASSASVSAPAFAASTATSKTRSRVWYNSNVFRVAATLVVFVGSAAVWSRWPGATLSGDRATAPRLESVVAVDTQMPPESVTALAAKSPPVAAPARAIADRASGGRADAARYSASVVESSKKAETAEVVATSVAAGGRARVADASPPAAGLISASRDENRVAERSPMATPLPKPLHTISGKVVSENGSPLSNAIVTIAGSTPSRTVTDSGGRFRVQTADAETEISVRRLGYAIGSSSVRLDGRDSIQTVLTLQSTVLSLNAVVVSSNSAPAERQALAKAAASPVLAFAKDNTACFALSYEAEVTLSAIRPPSLLQVVTNDGVRRTQTVHITRWFGWHGTSTVDIVSMVRDRDDMVHGEAVNGRNHLKLTLHAPSDLWTGTAIVTIAGTSTSLPIRYSRVESGMCKF